MMTPQERQFALQALRPELERELDESILLLEDALHDLEHGLTARARAGLGKLKERLVALREEE